MSEKAITAIVSILIGITGLAILAIIVSRSSDTPNVLNRSASALSEALCTALSPISGNANCGNLIPSVTSRVIFGQ